MPSKYVRKTEQYSYTVDTLKQAIHAVRTDGRKIREVGRSFKIPESTIRKYLAKPINEVTQPSLGRKSIIPESVEQEMVDFMVLLCNLFYGLTPKGLRKLAYDYVEKNGINHNFNKESGLAGKDWMYSFLKRHPTIRLRQPENTSVNRINAFSKEEVTRFFDNLLTLKEKLNIDPTRMYNQDETGITVVQKKCSKVFATKGSKRVGAATSAERGRTITGVFCMSAGGHFIPPMMIYPRKRMSANLQKNGPDGAIYCCSNNGWTNTELFNEWLLHFKKHTRPTADEPVLLILDNHNSHISIESYKFCKENHIHMVSLPPHTSHRLQPLDLTFFGPLKNALSREYDLFMIRTGHQRITEYEVAELVKNAFLKVATLSNALSGFRAAGIHPYNPDKFSELDFDPARKLDELRVEAATDCDSPSTSAAHKTPSTATSPSVGLFDDPTPSTSTGGFTESHKKFMTYLPAFDLKKKSDRPRPKPTEVKTRKPREKQHSEILTSTPMKIKLELDIEKKKQKEEVKQQRIANKNIKVARKLNLGNRPKPNAKESMDKKRLQNKKKDNQTFGKKHLQKKVNKKKMIEEESDDSDVDEVPLCNDDESDDIDMELCGLCGDHGKDRELWYRCTLCGRWYHAACTANDSAKDFICDMCSEGV